MIKNLNYCLILLLFLSFASCQKEDILYEDFQSGDHFDDTSKPERGDRGGGKGKNKDDDSGSEEDTDTSNPFTVLYQLSNVDDADPLYQFAFNSSGTQVMFYTDSTITHWGTDYWGYWDEPYIVEDGVVSYTIGLSSTTYLFEDIGNNTFLVSKIVVTSPYNGGPSNTTETTPGEYSLLP